MSEAFVRVRSGHRTLFAPRDSTWPELFATVGTVLAMAKTDFALVADGTLLEVGMTSEAAVPDVIFVVDRADDGSWSAPAVAEFPKHLQSNEDRFPALPEALIQYVNDLKPSPHIS